MKAWETAKRGRTAPARFYSFGNALKGKKEEEEEEEEEEEIVYLELALCKRTA